MLSTSEIDSILENGEWETWREGIPRNTGARTQAALAWCASSYWRQHTPHLEKWKAVVGDLAQSRITGDMLDEMAETNPHRLPFPVIPLFEDEQLKDLCAVVGDADAAASLVEKLERDRVAPDSSSGDLALACWEALPRSVKQNLDYAAWLWMLPGRSGSAPVPSMEALAELGRIPTPRRTAALDRLRDAFRRGALAGMTPGDRTELGAVLGIEMGIATETELPDHGQQDRNQIRAAELFEGSSELGEWALVESEAIERRPGSRDLHPLVAMAAFLRENDYADSMDDLAWKRLERVFQRYPGLLDIDPANPEDPLPALVLACTVRSMETQGIVALGLLPWAGRNKRSQTWWRSLRMALRPMVRRGVWGNANDRWQTAIRMILSFAGRLEPVESAALYEAFEGDISWTKG